MSGRGAFSASRVPLPSRIQIQNERERLQKKERRVRTLLRCVAVMLCVFLLISTIAALWFPWVLVIDDGLAPTVRAGDVVLLMRSRKYVSGKLHAYQTSDGIFLSDAAENDAAEKQNIDTDAMYGVAWMRLRRDMTWERFR